MDGQENLTGGARLKQLLPITVAKPGAMLSWGNDVSPAPNEDRDGLSYFQTQ